MTSVLVLFHLQSSTASLPIASSSAWKTVEYLLSDQASVSHFAQASRRLCFAAQGIEVRWSDRVSRHMQLWNVQACFAQFPDITAK